VSDLDSVEGAAVTAGARVDATTLENVGRILTVTSGELRVTVSNGSRSTSGDPSVLPIHYVRDLAEPDCLYRARGLRPRIAAVDGVWADYVGEGGGLAALHHGELWINGVQHDLYGYRLLG